MYKKKRRKTCSTLDLRLSYSPPATVWQDFVSKFVLERSKIWILGPILTIYLNISKSICIWWPSFDNFVGPFSLFDGHLYFFVPPEQLRNSLSTMLQTLTFNATDEFSFWFPRRFYIEGIRLAAEWFPWSQAGNDPIIHFPLCDQDVQITPLWPRWSEFSSLFSNKMAFDSKCVACLLVGALEWLQTVEPTTGGGGPASEIAIVIITGNLLQKMIYWDHLTGKLYL